MYNLAALTLHIPSTAADTVDQWYVANPFPGRARLIAAYFAPATAVAANDTNYVEVDVLKNTTGAPTTYVSMLTKLMTTQVTPDATHDAAAMVIGTTRTLNLGTDAGKREFAVGEQIKVDKVDPGSGGILDGTFTFLFERIQ